eukprot:scaffold150332_cov20-Tisochrysis_lutea.AAC.1
MLFFLLRLRCHLLRLHRLRSLLHTAVLCCAVLCLYMLQAAEAVDAVVLQPGPRQVLVCCTLVDGGVPGHEAGCVQGRAGGDAVVVRARWGSVGEGDRQEGQAAVAADGGVEARWTAVASYQPAQAQVQEQQGRTHARPPLPLPCSAPHACLHRGCWRRCGGGCSGRCAAALWRLKALFQGVGGQ